MQVFRSEARIRSSDQFPALLSSQILSDAKDANTAFPALGGKFSPFSSLKASPADHCNARAYGAQE